MKHKIMNKLKSFSLVEIILAIGLFTLSISAFAFLSIDSYKTLQKARKRNESSMLSQGIINSILIIKNRSWGEIVDKTDLGPLYISYDNGLISVVNGEYSDADYSYNFEILNVYRDTEGNIVTEPSLGIEDPSSRKINLVISYSDPLLSNLSFDYSIILNNWNNYVIVHEDPEDFAGGSNEETKIIDENNGGIILDKVFIPDWCKPELSLSKFDLPGQSIGSGLSATPGNAFISTGSNASGNTFNHNSISSTKPPQIYLEGYFNDSKSNDIYVIGNYVYLATDSKSQSAMIVQTTTKPYTKVGYYGTNSSTKASCIHSNDSYGFIGYGRNIDIFNLSSKTGNRPKVTTITIGDYSTSIKDIQTNGNYLFVGTSGHQYELVIYNISNISSPVLAGQIDLNSIGASAIFVSEDSNKLFLGTLNSSTQKELFIIDTTNKSAPTLIADYDTNGMNINDLAIFGNRLIIGGSGTKSYIVLKIDDLSAPNLCGSLTINGSIYALDVVELNNSLYSYILTSDSVNELQVIEGGLGGGGGDEYGYAYVDEGTFTSAQLDLEAESFRLFLLDIYGTVPPETSLKIQLKISDLPDMSDATWFGPDGTENTYFEGLGSHEITSGDHRGQYLQYKIIMTSNGLTAPTLDKIEIYYGK